MYVECAKFEFACLSGCDALVEVLWLLGLDCMYDLTQPAELPRSYMSIGLPSLILGFH